MPLVQRSQQLLAAPARVTAPGLEDRGDDLLRRGIGRTPGPTRALLQPRRALPQVVVDPLVASLPRDAVQLPQLGYRKRVAKVIGDELRPLVHRGRLLPRHGHLLGALPGFPVSPMSLD